VRYERTDPSRKAFHGYIDFGSLAPAARALLGVLFPNDRGPTDETRGEAWARL